MKNNEDSYDGDNDNGIFLIGSKRDLAATSRTMITGINSEM